MRDCLEEATLFFGTFKCDHRAFGPWREDFLQKEKKMKYEALQRIRRVVGGTIAVTAGINQTKENE